MDTESDKSSWRVSLAELLLRGPSFPLERADFVAALEDGRGRALLHAQEYGLDGVLGDVVHSTWNCLAYDPQENGTRGDWSLEILDAAGKFDEAASQIKSEAAVGALRQPGLERWTKVQRVNVLTALSQRGQNWAKALLDQASKEGGSHSKGDSPCVEATRREVNEELRRPPVPEAQSSAREMIDWIESQDDEVPMERGYGVYLDLRRWGRKAAPEEHEEIIAAWDRTCGDLRQLLYTFLFRAPHVAPLVTARLIDAARSAIPEVKESALRALNGVVDPLIRSYALGLVSPTGLLGGDLALLGANYHPGDAAGIESALHELLPDANLGVSSRERFSPVERHELARTLRRVGDAKVPEIMPLLLAAYEITPCGECRGFIGDTMERTVAAPGWIRRDLELQPRGADEDWLWNTE